MKEFWNERYAQPEYAYGLNPNDYLKKILSRIHQQGKILFPAEGEGRNAVYAASLGFDVSALDYSDTAKSKALKLAEQNQVSIDYQIADLNEMELEDDKYDILVLIYAHFPPHIRKDLHLKLQKSLKKYGMVIIEGFSKNHLEVSKNNQRSSGPRDIEMLFTEKIIKDDFSSFETIELKEEIVQLDEGEFHQGQCSVIRYMGRKI